MQLQNLAACYLYRTNRNKKTGRINNINITCSFIEIVFKQNGARDESECDSFKVVSYNINAAHIQSTAHALWDTLTPGVAAMTRFVRQFMGGEVLRSKGLYRKASAHVQGGQSYVSTVRTLNSKKCSSKNINQKKSQEYKPGNQKYKLWHCKSKIMVIKRRVVGIPPLHPHEGVF